MTDDDVGTLAVRLARLAVEDAVLPRNASRARPREGDGYLPAEFSEKRGVFVTLRRHPNAQLRGCIGYPHPVYPLALAIRRAARSAALDDPRFPRVAPAELDRLTTEVSILTVPEPVVALPQAGLDHQVSIGVHGLIVEGYGTSGLLLPQVAVEQGWGPLEFLEETCGKAGLSPSAWKDSQVSVFRFSAEVFEETSPRGTAVPRPLSGVGPVS